MTIERRKKYLAVGSFILGFGFMGAMDGVIYHQILQWHSVIMDTTRTGQIVSDGIFHLLVTIALVIGGIYLWLAGNPKDVAMGTRRLIGGFLIGTGAFNLIEGVINHHILQIHRVKPGDPNAILYDLAFLALGLLLVLIGLAILRKRKEVN